MCLSLIINTEFYANNMVNHSSETSVNFHRATRRYVTKDRIIHIHRYVYFKSYKIRVILIFLVMFCCKMCLLHFELVSVVYYYWTQSWTATSKLTVTKIHTNGNANNFSETFSGIAVTCAILWPYGKPKNEVFFFVGWDCKSLGTAATSGLLHKPQLIDGSDCGAIGEMKIGRGNRSTRRKPAPAPLCPPQIPHDQTPGSNPGRRGGKPATNRLSYGAAWKMS
jgi:hypothetical protein